MSSLPVSVILPTYNRSIFLRKTIESILKQSVRCLEIIVVDDGSTDNTSEVIAGLAQEAMCPICYYYRENSGVAAARNFGINKARGSYLAFLDSDDQWRPEKLTRQYTMMVENPEYLVSHTRETWLRRGEHLNQKQKHIPRNGDIFEHCLQLCAVGMSTAMVKRQLFDEVGLFDENYPCCEDYEFWLRVSARFPFLLVDEPLTIKNGGREDQLSWRFRVGMDKFRIQALEKLLAQKMISDDQQHLLRNELVRKLNIYGNGCIRHGRQDEGQACLSRITEIEQMSFA